MGSATRTVVFTDLANYTASVARSDREALRGLLRQHEELVIPALERHGGRVVKNIGDSFMALFDAATDALRAGLDILEQCARGSLSIRVSAATGDVEEISGDAFGEAVNLSARINGRTPANELWFSESTLACMNQAEIAWEPIGLFELKGIPGSVPLYRGVPRHRAWLPDPLLQASLEQRLLLVEHGRPLPHVPADALVLLLGFPTDPDSLQGLLGELPVLEPSRLWLAAHRIPPLDRHRWLEDGHGLVVGTPESIRRAIERSSRQRRLDQGANTITFDVGAEAALELALVGLALPSVPMSEVVAGYSYDLLPDGRWTNRSDHPLLRVEVGPDGVFLLATSPHVRLDGKPLAPGSRHPLVKPATIEAWGTRYQYHAMPEGSPYLGVIVAPTPSGMLIAEGERAELGREPNHPGIALPDRRGQSNLRWCSGGRARRARESGFSLDRALAGRHQAAVWAEGGELHVEALHPRCPTYLWRRSGSIERVQDLARAELGDHIVAGTSVVALRRPDL